MAYDPYANYSQSLTSPAQQCFEITPSDDNELLVATRAVYIGQEGDVAVVPINSESAVIFRNVPTGSIIDVRAKAIRLTGTTAQNIVGLA